MAGVFATIHYTGSKALADGWWRLMEQTGSNLRFYVDHYRPGLQENPPRLTDEPTKYGAWVYFQDKVLAVVFWDWERTEHDYVPCLICPGSESGLVVHYMMMASGLRGPHLPLNDLNPQELMDFIGAMHSLYSLSDDTVAVLREYLQGQLIDQNAAQLILPDCFTVITLGVGQSSLFGKPGQVRSSWDHAWRLTVKDWPSLLP